MDRARVFQEFTPPFRERQGYVYDARWRLMVGAHLTKNTAPHSTSLDAVKVLSTLAEMTADALNDYWAVHALGGEIVV